MITVPNFIYPNWGIIPFILFCYYKVGQIYYKVEQFFITKRSNFMTNGGVITKWDSSNKERTKKSFLRKDMYYNIYNITFWKHSPSQWRI